MDSLEGHVDVRLERKICSGMKNARLMVRNMVQFVVVRANVIVVNVNVKLNILENFATAKKTNALLMMMALYVVEMENVMSVILMKENQNVHAMKIGRTT